MLTTAEKHMKLHLAIRVFHYYRKYWRPNLDKKLICIHEQKKVFDMFAIKTCLEDGRTVGHLPREVSRICKFLLDCGASMTVELTSTNYRRFPLVKGGLEIPCKINVNMLSTVTNVKPLNKFEELFTDLYIEPESPQILGSILQDGVIFKEKGVEPRQKIRKQEKPQTTTSSDIQKFFKPNNKNDEVNKNDELNKK